LVNSPATVDSDYRVEVIRDANNDLSNEYKEVFVGLINHGEIPISIFHGDRIAQIEIEPVLDVVFQESEEILPFEGSARTGGFGSTGR
jgi:dUTPase